MVRGLVTVLGAGALLLVGCSASNTPPGDVSNFKAGGPGCGLEAAAFCETFGAPGSTQGRAGELDDGKWSAGRMAPHFPSNDGDAIAIGPATISGCRAGAPAKVFPDQDALICDATGTVPNKHLLVATAAQYYGQNSYRIRQPFDFGNRTGKIVFDAEAYMPNPLLGWISLDVTEDPVNAPSFSIGGNGTSNIEGAMIPKNAFEIQFQHNCAGYTYTPSFGLSAINVFNNYVNTPLAPSSPVCLAEQQGALSHFEILVSQTKIEVYGTPFSADGVTFATPVLLHSAAVNLPFSRGYVQISVHNHATIKYSDNNALDAWTARWGMVGFDGPIVDNRREYSIPDALTVSTVNTVSVGYRVADAANGPATTHHFKGVDPNGVTSARLSVSAWYLSFGGGPLDTYMLQYRLNGGLWHNHSLSPEELAMFAAQTTQGAMAEMLDVPVSELVAGDNTLEFVTTNVPQGGAPPVVANIDLILETKP